MKKKTKYEELKDLYGFFSGDIKWCLKGGEILKFIGQEIVFVDYKRDPETKKMSNTIQRAKVVNVYGYDPVTMTYKIDYVLPDQKDVDVIKTETIIPEGFSYDIMGQGIQNSMHRFTSFSLHAKVMEEDNYYKRLDKLFEEKSTLPWGAIQALAENKEQSKTLQYSKYIAVVIKRAHKIEGKENELEYIDDSVLQFRLWELRTKHVHKSIWRLTLVDSNKKSYNIEVDIDNDKEYYELMIGQEYIGDVKLIDLVGENTGAIPE